MSIVTRITCRSCHGTRRTSVMIPETRQYTVHLNDAGYPAWPADGGKPARMSYETGRMVERFHECSLCHGRGELLLMDAHGEYDSASVEYCTCDVGRELEIAELAVAHAAAHDDRPF